MKKAHMAAAVIFLVALMLITLGGLTGIFQFLPNDTESSNSSLNAPPSVTSPEFVTADNLTIASITVPTVPDFGWNQTSGWENNTLYRVSLQVFLGFKEDEPSWHSSFVSDSSSRLLASMGIRVVNQPPFDANLSLFVGGNAEWSNYVPEGSYQTFGSGGGKSYPTAAHADVHISVDGIYEYDTEVTIEGVRRVNGTWIRDQIGRDSSFSTEVPKEILSSYSLADTPMKDAIATPLLDCFAGIWGQRVYINALVDSSQKIEIRQAANQTLLEFDYFTEEEPTPRILSRLQDSRNDVSVDIGLARKYYPDLLFALQNGDTFARASSAQIIGIVGINADDALSVLLQATRDKENLVRLEAVKAIGYILRYTVGPARPTAEEITAVLTEVMNEAQKSGNTELAAACSKTLSMIDGQ